MLHLPFSAPHSTPYIASSEVSFPFLFVLFTVSTDSPFIHLVATRKQRVTPELVAYCIL